MDLAGISDEFKVCIEVGKCGPEKLFQLKHFFNVVVWLPYWTTVIPRSPKAHVTIETLEDKIDNLKREISSLNIGYKHLYGEIERIDIDIKHLLEQIKSRMDRLELLGFNENFLNELEVEQLIENAPTPSDKLIFTLIYTYARPLEDVLNLKWEDVDLEGGFIKFRNTNSGLEFKYPLSIALAERFRSLKENGGAFIFKSVASDETHARSYMEVRKAFEWSIKLAGIKTGGRWLIPDTLRKSRIHHLGYESTLGLVEGYKLIYGWEIDEVALANFIRENLNEK